MGFEKRVKFSLLTFSVILTFYAVFGWEQDLFCFALFMFVLNQALLFKTISIFLFCFVGACLSKKMFYLVQA